MHVVRYRNLDELALLASEWNRLARGVPFRSWAWARTWWRHYGRSDATDRGGRELFVLAVLDGRGRPWAIAPWYCQTTRAQGRVLRFLGSGEVCSDYLSVLCMPGTEESVGDVLADWLTSDRSGAGGDAAWDLLELTGVDGADRAVGCLADQLAARRLPVHRRRGPNCWRIALPDRWSEYLGTLSRNHRKQLRRLERQMAASGRFRRRSVEDQRQLRYARQILVDLHQRRRHALGQPGCFASVRFTAFHFEVMSRLLGDGQLRLEWIERDGRPIAIDYQLAGAGVIYAYQSGMEPEAMVHSPGRLNMLLALRRAVEDGCRAYDLLRGDEPYKAHWRAQPRPSLEIRVPALHASARLRHALWLAGANVKQWLLERNPSEERCPSR